MKFKSEIMDEEKMRRSLSRIAHEIIEKNNGADEICLLGIKRRGISLANILHDDILAYEGMDVPLGQIDISLYRDDLTEIADQAQTSGCLIPVELKKYTVILVDDVLYTGRTARAAIEAVFAHGRPRSIQLAVLVDRGHRELPIRPDYVGKNIPTSRSEVIRVMVPEYDGKYGVSIWNL